MKHLFLILLVLSGIAASAAASSGVSDGPPGLPPSKHAETAGIGDWPMFQGSATHVGRSPAKPITTPAIHWRQKIGIQSWLNNPIVVGARVYSGSSGSAWNHPDAEDGIYCLDLADGRVIWFHPLHSDANGVAYANGVVIATSDDGSVMALDSETGSVRWRQAGLFANPALRLFGLSRMYTNPLIVGDMVFTGDGTGQLFAMDLGTGDIRWATAIGGAIRGGASSDGRNVVVGGTAGTVACLDMDGSKLWTTRLATEDESEEEHENWKWVEIYAPATIVGDLVIVSASTHFRGYRSTLSALDLGSGKLIWHVSDPGGLVKEWGNLRSSPAVYSDLLIFGAPQVDDHQSVIAVGSADGEVRWAATIGAPIIMNGHWPSPAITGDIAIIPRQDGGLYGVDVANGTLRWRIFLGQEASGGRFPPGWVPAGERYADRPAIGEPIFSSPAVARSGVVVVGTGEGYLYAIGDEPG